MKLMIDFKKILANGALCLILSPASKAKIFGWVIFKGSYSVSKWSSISFWHCQCPLDGDFSFSRFAGLLILSLWD
jgi:hypothetical protein